MNCRRREGRKKGGVGAEKHPLPAASRPYSHTHWALAGRDRAGESPEPTASPGRASAAPGELTAQGWFVLINLKCAHCLGSL